MSTHQELSQELHEEFQRRSDQFLAPNEGEDPAEHPTAGVLTGWFLVCEWAGDDGESWISYHRPPSQPIWRSRGFLVEASYDL